MLAKKTSKNQITLPKAIASNYAGIEYFEISEIDGRIVLEPAYQRRPDAVRSKLAQLDIKPDDIEAAITWARRAK